MCLFVVYSITIPWVNRICFGRNAKIGIVIYDIFSFLPRTMSFDSQDSAFRKLKLFRLYRNIKNSESIAILASAVFLLLNSNLELIILYNRLLRESLNRHWGNKTILIYLQLNINGFWKATWDCLNG